MNLLHDNVKFILKHLERIQKWTQNNYNYINLIRESKTLRIVLHIVRNEWYLIRKLLFVAESMFVNSHLFQPVCVRKRKIRKSSLPLYKIPGSPYIVIPGYHPLHGVTDHVHIDWHVQVKPGEYKDYISFMFIGCVKKWANNYQ